MGIHIRVRLGTDQSREGTKHDQQLGGSKETACCFHKNGGFGVEEIRNER